MAFLVTNVKEARMYARFLQIIKSCTNEKWQPEMIMADFETGIHAAIQQAFGGKTKSRKCWFHLTQSVSRHLESKGIMVAIYIA